jgi:hypothetical protein
MTDYKPANGGFAERALAFGSRRSQLFFEGAAESISEKQRGKLETGHVCSRLGVFPLAEMSHFYVPNQDYGGRCL